MQMNRSLEEENKTQGRGLSRARLIRAISKADIRVLLMVLYHLSADERWLSPPYRPVLDRKLIGDEDGGLPSNILHEIRQCAVDALSSYPLKFKIQDPGNSEIQKMMSVCLGEPVPIEYAPMMREEMGFCDRFNSLTHLNETSFFREPVIIVGAGASGIALAVSLKKANIPFLILEKNPEAGGTWYNNIYPGCGVDTPSHAYSYSFGRRYNWSRFFSPQQEIQDYLVKKTTEFDIRKFIEFQTEVTEVNWIEADQYWRIQAKSGDEYKEFRAKAIVSAIGQLNVPAAPTIAGSDEFTGEIFHSVNWQKSTDIKGKSIAIIGNGASAMQIVPTIVKDVSSLTIYQRSAQWARPIPRYHDILGEDTQWLLDEVPYYGPWFRFVMLWRYGDGLLSTLRKDPEWNYPERSVNRHNDRHREELTAHIRSELANNEELIKKCLPSYPPYGKRILLDNGWYKALRHKHVELVCSSIHEISQSGVITEDGEERPADIIILATGFQVTQMAARLNVTGRQGSKLDERWAPDNPSAYLGITIPDFPNFFCMQGPNTGLGHGGSAIFQAECQARYILQGLQQMATQGIQSLCVKQEVHDKYVAQVDSAHSKLIWTHPGMSTYYRNSAGRVVSVMPWRLVDYWQMTRTFNLNDYHMRR